VIPTQFVLFTISTIVGSAILYDDFKELGASKIMQFVFGCMLTFLGVYFITSNRDKVMHRARDDFPSPLSGAGDYLEDTFSGVLERQQQAGREDQYSTGGDVGRGIAIKGIHRGRGNPQFHSPMSAATPLLVSDNEYAGDATHQAGSSGNFAHSALLNMYSSSVPAYVHDKQGNINNNSRSSLSRLGSEMHHVLYTVGTRHSQSLGLVSPLLPFPLSSTHFLSLSTLNNCRLSRIPQLAGATSPLHHLRLQPLPIQKI
jgi:hypothetical protein